MMRDGLASSLILAIAALAGAGSAAHAQEASPWDEEPHGATRLIAGATQNTGDNKHERAGIEIRLEPGWKTYWRYPGDSGVPPALDFAGSENVKSVNTLWPAPEVFDDGAGGHSIGYHGDVVLPLQVIPNDAAKPSLLHIKLDYAVCGKLCVPAEAHLALTLSGKTSTEAPALAAAEARVPRRATLGEHGKGLSIASIRREPGGKHGRVIVLVGAPDGVPVRIFAEGPTPEWALPLPQPDGSNAGPDGLRRYTFELDGLPPGAKADGATLKLTAVSPTEAIEVEARLD